MPTSEVSIACAAGFADERVEPSLALVTALKEAKGSRYLMYETLGERTLALAQLDRRRDAAKGYAPRLLDFMRPVLADCIANNIRIVGNFGMANPRGAADQIRQLALELGMPGIKIAVVEGDDLMQEHTEDEIRAWPIMEGLHFGTREIIAANAYLGADAVAKALATDADVIITGRCTDSALALGPLIHEFGWAETELDKLAAGILTGHLLECSAQVTGGYFADPGFKEVPNVDDIGYPIATVDKSGILHLTKPSGTGGLVSPATVTEQLLYEVFDPAAYITPDVVADFSNVQITQVAPDVVRVEGARGKPRPENLKATISVDGGWLAEGEISYAGPNALARAKLAADILTKRLKKGVFDIPFRLDIIGTLCTFDSNTGALRAERESPPDGDYRVRLAGQCPDRQMAERVAQEVISLYNTGPAGGGGVRKAVTQRVQTGSALVPRSEVTLRVISI